MNERRQGHHRSHHEVRFELYKKLFLDLGHPLKMGARILDFGCANGHMVSVANSQGFKATGCDLAFDTDAALNPDADIRIIQQDPYRLPYEDSSIDVVFSDQVMEHVMDYDSAARELHRVMKPGAVMLHLFPPRWCPIERHVWVPFASVLRAKWWLAIWALLGVRNPYQRGDTWRNVMMRNYRYLRTQTNYPPNSVVERQFGMFDTSWQERAYLKYAGRGRPLAKSAVLSWLYASLHQRVLFGQKKVQPAVVQPALKVATG